MKQVRYAFWSYDLFPYVVSGEIEKVINKKKRHYELVGFGRITFCNEPVILNKKQGEALRDQLEELKGQFKMAEKTLKKGFVFELDELFAEFKVERPGK